MSKEKGKEWDFEMGIGMEFGELCVEHESERYRRMGFEYLNRERLWKGDGEFNGKI